MTNQPQTALEHDFARAAADLRSALKQAADAINAIEALLPHVGGIAGALAQLDAALQTARQQTGLSSGDAAPGPAVVSRPTLVVPGASPERAEMSETVAPAPEAAPFERVDPDVEVQRDPGLTSFRLEFESRSGPLDLRAVDEAVSEHAAVRDVALLDYDGRHASLKVWIDGSASPAHIKGALVERADTLFGDDNDVTIIALEDAA